MKKLSFLTGAIVLASASAFAQISNFSQWTLVEDPAHPQMSASQGTVSVTLTAGPGGAIPSGTDIGFTSVNGNSYASSNFGYGFDPNEDFWIMVDFDMGFLGSNFGGLIAGFGVGEDVDGMDSVGVTLVTYGGFAPPGGFTTGYFGVSRTDDVTSLPEDFFADPNANLNGSMSVRYFANTGTFFVGVGAFGANDILESIQYAGLQNSWDNDHLIPSLFLRSQQPLGGIPFETTGKGEVVFSNFRILEGEAVRAIPEPSTYAAIFGVIALGLAAWRRKRSR